MARNKKARPVLPVRLNKVDAINASSSPPQESPQCEYPDSFPGLASIEQVESELQEPTISQASALKEKADKIHWNFTMEETLFQALIDGARAGKRADQGFKTEAWVDVLSKVQAVAPAKTRPLLNLSKLKSKESNYKALYKDWKWLIAQSGFGIHPETRVVTASAEAWDEVLQVSKFMFFYSTQLITTQHRKSCKWHRYNALEFTELLDELYATTIATGSRAITLTHTSTNSQILSNIDPSLEVPSNSSTPTINAPLRKRKRGPDEMPIIRKTRCDDSSGPIEKVLEGIQQLANSRRPTVHVALELLEKEYKRRLTEDDMDKAYDFLEDEAKAIFFTGIRDKEGRDRWLERKTGVELLVSDWELSD